MQSSLIHDATWQHMHMGYFIPGPFGLDIWKMFPSHCITGPHWFLSDAPTAMRCRLFDEVLFRYFLDYYFVVSSLIFPPTCFLASLGPNRKCLIHLSTHTLRETRDLPSAKIFAECQISGTRQRPALPSAALGKIWHSAKTCTRQRQTLGKDS